MSARFTMPPDAPAPAAATALPPRPAYLFARAVLENLEALAIAIVMALILKFFLIEAYKIPTGSMQPTIIGEKAIQVFDRVLVNKLVYFLREPERWEVIVFKMPLIQRQNYIKRLVGLPGEIVHIRNGDIFIVPSGGGEESIARKPESVWRSVRKRIIPNNPDLYDLGDQLRVVGRGLVSPGSVKLQPQESDPARVETVVALKDGYFDGYHPAWIPAHATGQNSHQQNVTDVEVRCLVDAGKTAESLLLELTESGYRHRATLDLVQGTWTLETLDRDSDRIALQETEARGESPLRAGLAAELLFRNLDDELLLELNGEEVARRPYVTRGTQADRPTHLSVTATGGPVTLRRIEVFRDIHYLPRSGPSNEEAIFEVPEGHYFALGDNTQNSHDCRQWKLGVFELADGRTLLANLFEQHTAVPDANPRYHRGDLYLTNIYGETLRLEQGDVVRREEDDFHTVAEEFLQGKALAVFWPLPPISPTWRLKWVR